MKQHTTQEQAKELPVLPEPDVYEYDIESGMNVLKAHSPDRLQAYGAACAEHAREVALSEVDDILAKLKSNFFDPDMIRAAVKTLKKAGK